MPDTINPENLELHAVGDTEVYPTPYGVLIPMNNAQALADATMYVLENPGEFDRNQITEYASTNYNQRRISADVIIPAFEETIENFKNCNRTTSDKIWADDDAR